MIVSLLFPLMAQTAVPEGGPTREWRFINFLEVMSEAIETVDCTFRDVAGDEYSVRYTHSGETAYIVGGYPAWDPDGDHAFEKTPTELRVFEDDTGLFASADLPRAQQWREPIETRDGWHSFKLNVARWNNSGKPAPATVTATKRPPPPMPIEGPAPDTGPDRALALAGFCTLQSTQQTLSLELLNKLGREAQ